MVTQRQKKNIEKLMRRIKDAKDSGKDKAVIERRTKQLYVYLEKEGIVNRFDE